MPKSFDLLSVFPNLEEVTPQGVLSHLNSKYSLPTIQNWLGNKLLYPGSIATTSSEQVLYRALIDELMRMNQKKITIPALDNTKINSRLRIKKQTVTHVRRSLGGVENIKIMVKEGAQVHPEDLLATGTTSGGFRTIHLAHELESDPSLAVSFLQRRLGERIYQGEVLASRHQWFGFKKKLLLAPTDGILELYDPKSGDLKVKMLPQTQKLVSGVYGIVERVEEHSGSVIIKSLVDLIYGVIGCGQERGGMLDIVADNTGLISSKQISGSILSGHIIVGGGLVFLDAVEKAISSHAEGIICGGINAADYRSIVGDRWNIHNKKWMDAGISLIATEGFGSIPLGNDIFELLKSHQGNYSIMDGNRARIILPSQDQNSMIYVRKTQLPMDRFVETQPQVIPVKLNKTDTVRVISGPMLGAQGIVGAIDDTPTLLPSGQSSIMVTVETQRQKNILPIQNLEVI